MVNCNPETVSTDYDTSDRLYFEPLSPEEVLAVLDREQPVGVVTQFGGQTPLRLARHIEAAGYRILGHAARGDRPRRGPRAFRRARAASSASAARPGRRSRAPTRRSPPPREIGYPVLVRPSYVLGGRAMRICYDEDDLRAAMAAVSGPVLVDRFVENAIEIDVDALCDGEEVYIGAVMQHVEEAGVHSGDSSCVLPAQSLTLANALEVEHVVKRLGPALGVVGLLNVQLAIADATVYVLEANPRASRTVPFASKAIGINLVEAACRLAAGETLADLGAAARRGRRRSASRRPCSRSPASRAPTRCSGPEMRSTGEVMASAADLPTAFAKAERAAGRPLPTAGTAFLSVRDGDKPARRADRGRARRARVRARRDRAARRGRCARPGSRWRRSAKVADAEPGEPTVVDLIRERPLRPRRQHAAGLRRPRGRLPDPRGGARRARAVHHDDRRRRGRRARDRERARRGGAVAAGADRRRRDALRRRPLGADARASCSASSATSAVGPYTLAAPRAGRARAGDARPVLHARGAGPRAAAADVSLCLAPRRRARLPRRPDRAGDARARRARAGRRDPRPRARSATASTSPSSGRCSSAAASAIAPLPYLSERLGGPPALLGFRTAHHAEAAALVPNAEVVLEPTLVTDALPADPGDVLACGPEPMLDALAPLVPGAQLAWEAPMACGYGACYGCVVESRRPLRAALRRRARPRGGGAAADRAWASRS